FEAIRLGRALAELMPDESDVHGLLALMLLHESRRAARLRDDQIVLLADQDRALWNAEQLEAGRGALERAVALHGRRPGGLYTIQAAIAALHTEEPRDWPQIAALYNTLSQLTDSPVVALNRAIAIGELHGPEAGLELLAGLPLDGYRYVHSTRAEMLRRLGRTSEARTAYREALARTRDDAERRLFARRLGELEPSATTAAEDQPAP
ncbi:MAG: DUF6596 domain-containing protein, partial [Solirubrobacteraceae bacterium]